MNGQLVVSVLRNLSYSTCSGDVTAPQDVPCEMNSETDQAVERLIAKSDMPAEQVRQHRPSIVRSVLSNWAGFIISTLIGFFLSPFVVRHLGDSGYGIWVLLGSLTGYLGLLDLGVRGAVTRYVASLHAVGDHLEVGRVTSAALAIFLGGGLVAITTSIALSLFAVNSFHIPASYLLAARMILIITGFSIAVSLVGGVFGGILVALERFDLVNLLEVSVTICRTGTIVVMLLRGNGLITLAVIQLLFTAATGGIYGWISFRQYPQLQVRVGDCDRAHVKMLLSFSVYIFVLMIANNLIFYTDSAVIGYFLPVSLITVFAIAGNLVNYTRALIRGISITTTPRSSALNAEGDKDGLRRLLVKGSQYATIIVLPVALTFILRGRTFVSLWMGPQYGEPSGHVLWILALALIFMAGELVAMATMIGINKHKLLARIYFAEAFCNFALSIALVRRLGIIGVAWGTTLPALAVSLLFWPSYVRHTLGLPIRTYLTATWMRPAFTAMPFGILTYAVEKLWPAPNVFVFLGQTLLILPSVAIATWYLCFDLSERKACALKLVLPVWGPLEVEKSKARSES
jgi:O-antigen/teichoic acid export membrane protein